MPISSQSTRRQYKEYVNPLDLNVFASVMQNQQQKFDQGAQVLQSKIDGFSSLDVLADEDKQYLNSKINETVKGVNSLGGADLSDSSVTAQLSAHVGSIGKDPRIINAVMDTKKVRSLQAGRAQIKKDYDAGKKGVFNSAANEYIENQAVQSYIESKKKDPNARYEGSSSPISYYDHYKKLDSIGAKMKASAVSKIETSPNQYMYVMTDGKRLTEEQIWQAASLGLSPEEKGQMSRDGMYQYRNASNEQIISEFTEANNRKIADLTNRIKNAKDVHGVSDPKLQEQLQGELEHYTNEVNKTKVGLQSALSSRREAVIGKLFEARMLEGIAKKYAYSEEKQKPIWDQGRMHSEKMQQSANQFGATLKLNQAKEQFHQDDTNRKYKADRDDEEWDRAHPSTSKTKDANGKDILPDGTSVDISVPYIAPSFKGEVKTNTTEALAQSNAEIKKQKDQINQSFYDDYANQVDPTNQYGYFTTDASGHKKPTANWIKLNQAVYNTAQDMANGKPTQLGSLPEEFVDNYKKIKVLETQQKTNQLKINGIIKESMVRTRAELNANGKDLNDEQWATYERGRLIQEKVNASAVKTTYNAVGPGGTVLPSYSKPAGEDPIDKLSLADRRAYDYFNSKYKTVNPIIQKNRETIEKDESMRLNSVGLTLSNTQLKSNGLKNAIISQSQGYYTMGANGEVESTNEKGTEALSDENFTPISQITSDLGKGAGEQHYVVGNLTTGSKDDKTTKRIYIPIDEETNKKLLTSIDTPSLHVEQHMKNSPTKDYYGMSFGTPTKGRYDTAVDYRLFQQGDNYKIQVKQPYKEDGSPLNPPIWVTINRKYDNIDATYQLGESLASLYQQENANYKAKYNKKLSFREFIQNMP